MLLMFSGLYDKYLVM